MSSPSNGLVVVCGTSFWGGTPLLERHVAEHLLEFVDVLYVDPPVSRLTHLRSREAGEVGAEPGLRQDQPGLNVLSVRVVPLKGRPGVRYFSTWQTRRAIAQAIRQLGSPPVRALLLPSLDPLFGSANEEVGVFYVKDDYVAGASLMGIQASRIDRWFDARLKEADEVIVVSHHLEDLVRARGVDSRLVPNGVNPDLFARAEAPSGTEAGVAFVGHLSSRIDLELLDEVATTGVPVLMIGPVQETLPSGSLDRLRARANVEWLGRVPYVDLPRALSRVTTCLLPYRDTEFNRASFPLKILEYLAAGRRVVSTDLPSVRWLGTGLVDVAQRQDFARTVKASLALPLTGDEMAARRAFAAKHDWRSRTRTVAEVAGLLEASPANAGAPDGVS